MKQRPWTAPSPCHIHLFDPFHSPFRGPKQKLKALREKRLASDYNIERSIAAELSTRRMPQYVWHCTRTIVCNLDLETRLAGDYSTFQFGKRDASVQMSRGKMSALEVHVPLKHRQRMCWPNKTQNQSGPKVRRAALRFSTEPLGVARLSSPETLFASDFFHTTLIGVQIFKDQNWGLKFRLLANKIKYLFCDLRETKKLGPFLQLFACLFQRL